MSEHSLWKFSRVLHRALQDQRSEELSSVIDENVEWAIYGPIEMFPFLGSRRGKSEVLKVCSQIGKLVNVKRLDRESIMLGENSAASLLRYSLTRTNSDKSISLRLAQFSQFRDDRLISMRAVVDTFDLVEQALGRPIDLPTLA